MAHNHAKNSLDGNEMRRQATLESYEILDTLPETQFDDITLIASQICKTKIALISFVDRDWQWFKSSVGINVSEIPRENSFCDFALKSGQSLFEVKNASEDERFKNNLLVVNQPNVAFYAGAALIAENGETIGTLCVIDSKAYELNLEQRESLQALARQVVALLELRKLNFATQKKLASEKSQHAQSVKDHHTLEIMFDTSPTGLAIVREPDFIFEKTNEVFKRMNGSKDFTNQKWSSLYPDQVGSIIEQGLKSVYNSGERFEKKALQTSLRDDQGLEQARFIDISFDRLDADESKNFSILIQTTDVTIAQTAYLAKEAEEARNKAAHARVKSILDVIPVGIAVFEGPACEAVLVNSAFEKMAGGEKLVSRTFVDPSKQTQSNELGQLLQIVYRKAIPYHTETRRSGNLDILSNIKDAAYQLSCQPLKARDGEIYGVSLTAVDVTELTTARDAARESAARAMEAESKLSQAVQIAKVGFFELDISSNIFYYSEQFQKDWSLASKSTLAEGLCRIVPEDRERIEDLVARSLLNNSAYSAEYRILRPSDNKVLWISAEGRIIEFQGRAKKFIGTTIDITDRKEAELELYAVANSIPQLAWTATPDGNINWYNDQWVEFSGKTKDELAGFGWQALHYPEHFERVLNSWTKANTEGKEWEVSFPLRRKDGVMRWFLGRGVPILNTEGKILRWFGTNTDITDQLNNEQALTRLASVVESSRDFIGITDEDFNPLFLNRGARNISGFNDRDITKSRIADFFPAAEVPKLENDIIPHVRKSGYWEGEMYFKHFESGELIPVLYNLFPIIDRQGMTIGYATVTRDISDQKKNEADLKEARYAAEHANAAKSAFLANMSHEIRTPLGAIMGFSDLARISDNEPEDLQNYLSVIHRNSIQTLKIVDDILDLAKVEAGKILIELIETELISFLADFGSLMGFKARENGIQFTLRAETDLPSWIIIDPTRVRQVLTNAVGNAVKFTPQGGSVQLHVCYVGGYLKFGITDTGRGISEDQAKNLFQAFVQADDSTTRKFGGTGLGLVLSKKLCVQMGGDFTLERSELGKGSHFVAKVFARCPAKTQLLRKGDVQFQTDTKSSTESGKRLLNGIKVLVVEDSPDNQALLKIILSRQGAIFDLAKDGIEGVEKAQENAHDIILMDVQMPRMDGHEAIKKMRQIGIEKPVIALTAHAMKEEYYRAMQSGFTDYLTKPVDKTLLVNMILKYVSAIA